MAPNQQPCPGYGTKYKDCPGCNYPVEGCDESCVYAPLFVANGTEDIAAAFNVFGATKFQFETQDLPIVRSIKQRIRVFEANAREYDRVYGTTGIVLSLHKKLRALTGELNDVKQKLNASNVPIMPFPSYTGPDCPSNCPGCNYPVIGGPANCVYGPMFYLAPSTDIAHVFGFFEAARLQFRESQSKDVFFIRQRTIIFEANAREYDPVYGTTGILLSLHKRLLAVAHELKSARYVLSLVPSSAITTVKGKHSGTVQLHLEDEESMMEANQDSGIIVMSELNGPLSGTMVEGQQPQYHPFPNAAASTTMGRKKRKVGALEVSVEAPSPFNRFSTPSCPSLPAATVPVDARNSGFSEEEIWANSLFKDSGDPQK